MAGESVSVQRLQQDKLVWPALRGEMEFQLPYCRSRIVGPFWRVLTIWLVGQWCVDEMAG